MNELRSELETELRALEIAPAPVAGAMRAGRRLRHRRRFAVVAGAVAVVAIAAGVPVLTRASAGPAPLPVTRPTLPDGDPVVTDTPPGRGAPAGEIAQGTIGARTWRVGVSKIRTYAIHPLDYCITIAGTVPGSPDVGCGPAGTITGPATFFESQGPNPGGTAEATIGTVVSGVTYLELAFSDGQQLKLIPVTVEGHRFVAFLAPVSMTIASVTAHLGTAGHDNGQTETAIPFSLPGQLPLFGLWQRPGQAAAPRASRAIAGGVTDGKPWSLTAYEGPWGTCFVPDPPGTTGCEQRLRLATTNILGGWGGIPPGSEVAYGSAAPGVASVVVRLSNGKTVTARPVAVGNERLFAFPVGAGVSPSGWTAYSASGAVVGQSPPLLG